jgi:hypothetical protein
MKTLLTNLGDLEGKTIHSVEIDGSYSPDIVITTTTDEILIISVSSDDDRVEVRINTLNDLGYFDKSYHDLLTEEEIFNHQVEEERNIIEQKKEQKKKEEEEKIKIQKEEERVRKSELELLEKLKNKYEKK